MTRILMRGMHPRRAMGRVVFLLAVLTTFTVFGWGASAKNVILLIADGAGFNAFHCSSYFEYGQLGKQPYDAFAVRLGCTTNPFEAPLYDPAKSWSDFKSQRSKATDSAAAATALYTGVKTENKRISTGPDKKPLTTIAEIAHGLGKSAGIVSSVPFSHATPGAVFAHNEDRKNTDQIAEEIVYRSSLAVVFSPGHPRYDSNGKKLPHDKWKDSYCPEEVYQALVEGTTGRGWTFMDSKRAMEALAADPRPEPNRVFGLAKSASTLQYDREGKKQGRLNGNVPTLETMSLAALNVLNKDEDGFFLMIEGGAVDWANHGNNLDRMVEEFADFNKTIASIMNWLDQRGLTRDTLVIVTSDHECGQIWGPDAGEKSKTPFDLPKSRGKGKLPDAKHYATGHTNVLVPLYATGPGSEFFHALVDGVDTHAARAWQFSGQYVDNTDVFTVMKAAIVP
ncbi:MAG: alkaline phosphatase [Sedimentisphaerales bacterium]|nr:alkaline phosphatase [Sedimentisphaerales bacterium]